MVVATQIMLATHALVIMIERMTRVEWSASGAGRASFASISSGERLGNWIPPALTSIQAWRST